MTPLARRLFAALLVMFGAALTLVVAAPAASADTDPDCGYPINGKVSSLCACPTISVSTTVPEPGEAVQVTGVNFLPDKTIQLFLKPVKDTPSTSVINLKKVRSDGQGSFATSVIMPRSASGTYDLHASGGTPGGDVNGQVCPADPSQRLRLGADGDGTPNNNSQPNSGPTNTAFTGFNMLWLLLLAAALIALGVYIARRGRRTDAVRSIHG